ncbi:MAG: TIR domain-containing protein [Deltaproteobacteria bacterium]|jgi:hypothetical protein|nr:TIR domain-containing protein [Deltaproteobacteria bacterium]
MARQTFFSFHFKDDNSRAGVVRNSWVTQDRKAAGFFDSAEWEKVKKKQDSDIEKWIDGQLNGTSVTVVLIGQNTAGRKWINYEITSSHKKGNGLLGIYIHNIKNLDKKNSLKGKNPFKDWTFKKGGNVVTYPVYDWVNDDGYKNMGDWIEKAAKAAGK